jgi:putative FmdB family regulatory protein
VPTYQYACTEAGCGHAFEQVQSFTEDALTVCPECHGRLRKVFNAVGVVFKGSGFYRTDSRAGAGGGDGSEATKGTGKEAGAAKKTDTAPAAGGSGSTNGSGGKAGSGSPKASSAAAGAGAA